MAVAKRKHEAEPGSRRDEGAKAAEDDVKAEKGPSGDGEDAGMAFGEGAGGDAGAGERAEEPESTDGGDASDADARFEELSERYVRLVADFDNFRRRTRANEQHIRQQAAANLIKELLPVIDNLQLALGNVGDGAEDGFAQGIQLIEQQLLTALHNHGLRPLETKGQPFDPRTMEAVAQIDGGDGTEPGHVVEELRRGYVLHDVVLRAAQVVVAQQD